MSKKKADAKRENELTAAYLGALIMPTEALVEAFLDKAERIAESMSKSAVARARRRSRDAANTFPPGYGSAMRAIRDYERIMRRHKVPMRDQNEAWNAAATMCLYSLYSGIGAFHDSAERHGLTARVDIGTILDRLTSLACGFDDQELN